MQMLGPKIKSRQNFIKIISPAKDKRMQHLNSRISFGGEIENNTVKNERVEKTKNSYENKYLWRNSSEKLSSVFEIF